MASNITATAAKNGTIVPAAARRSQSGVRARWRVARPASVKKAATHSAVKCLCSRLWSAAVKRLSAVSCKFVMPPYPKSEAIRD
jgi:hypothetical protein